MKKSLLSATGSSHPAPSTASAAKRASVLGFATLLIAGLGGCAGARSTNAAANFAQLIIKFRRNPTDPTSAALQTDLSRSAGASVVYARPMSGGAHVFTLSGFQDEAALERAIKALAQRSDVEYVELDRKQRLDEPSQ